MTQFNLPVFGGATAVGAEDLLRISLRAGEIFDSTIADPVPLDFGVAMVSEEFSAIAAANCVQDIVASTDGRGIQEMIGRVEALFAARKLRCLAWRFVQGRTPPEAGEILRRHGFVARRETLWLLQRAGREVKERDGLTVIPGRASFEGLRDLAAAAADASSAAAMDQHRSAAVRRLDDVQIDNLLALEGTAAVGTLYFVMTAQVGCVPSFFVHPERRRRGVGAVLLGRAIELAARSRVKHLTVWAETDDVAAEGLLRGAGFVGISQIETFARSV